MYEREGESSERERGLGRECTFTLVTVELPEAGSGKQKSAWDECGV